MTNIKYTEELSLSQSGYAEKPQSGDGLITKQL